MIPSQALTHHVHPSSPLITTEDHSSVNPHCSAHVGPAGGMHASEIIDIDSS